MEIGNIRLATLKTFEKTKLMRNMKTEKGHSLYTPVTPAHFSSLIQVSPFQQKNPNLQCFFRSKQKKYFVLKKIDDTLIGSLTVSNIREMRLILATSSIGDVT